MQYLKIATPVPNPIDTNLHSAAASTNNPRA
jgi:hypothetical protein